LTFRKKHVILYFENFRRFAIFTDTIIGFIWERLKGRFWSRLVACVVIALLLGVSALIQDKSNLDRKGQLLVLVCTGCAGVFVWFLLEFHNYRKRKRAKWNEISQGVHPDYPPDVMGERGGECGARHFSWLKLLTWLGVGLGLLSILCSIIMGIIRIVESCWGVFKS